MKPQSRYSRFCCLYEIFVRPKRGVASSANHGAAVSQNDRVISPCLRAFVGMPLFAQKRWGATPFSRAPAHIDQLSENVICNWRHQWLHDTEAGGGRFSERGGGKGAGPLSSHSLGPSSITSISLRRREGAGSEGVASSSLQTSSVGFPGVGPLLTSAM